MNLDFSKLNGILPAVIQDSATNKVLMVGFMDREAYEKTLKEGIVTFYSRTKKRIWQKGETSGNILHVEKIEADCDNDSLLIQVNPAGPVCHEGRESCFKDSSNSPKGFLYKLEEVIRNRISEKPDGSYTAKLYSQGVKKITQKVGEEAVELIIESLEAAKDKSALLNEAADLLYHLSLLLVSQGVSLEDVEQALKNRNSL